MTQIIIEVHILKTRLTRQENVILFLKQGKGNYKPMQRFIVMALVL